MEEIFNRYKTGISTVYERTKHGNKYDAIEIPDEKNKDKKTTISWFDRLFRGGIGLYKGKTITMLIKGPPGSGKSTLSTELCYRFGLGGINEKAFNSLYISFESDSEQIYSNIINSYGWDAKDNHQIAIIKNTKVEGEPSFSFFSKDNKERTKEEEEDAKKARKSHFGIWSTSIKDWNKFSEIFVKAIVGLSALFGRNVPDETKEDLKKIVKGKGDEKVYIDYVNPDILVIDSLNIIPVKNQKDTFETFLQVSKEKDIKLLIFILDNNNAEIKNPLWDYYCDIILEMSYENNHDYYSRTFEIVKARYQEHVWGKHHLKIFPKKIKELNEEVGKLQEMRIHPFRNEGGIFIFPSIHFYLSSYKRKVAKNKLSYDRTYPDSLNDILVSLEKSNNVGIPKGRCTAFIGCRGGHKSHLAYLHLIKRLEAGESTLIISLRDDEEMTVNTMKHIVDMEYVGEENKVNIDKYINSGKLEILYYIPGYITPEEFIHRIFVSIKKLKNESPEPITVMFNSLDQVNARFPLCAKMEIFIPSIIQILIGEEVTSIFITVDEKDQPNSQYGLLPMADLILSFYKYRMKHKTYMETIFEDSSGYDKELLTKENDKDSNREEVIVTVERHAGGQKAGGKGILELKNSMREKNKNSVNFIKLSDKFDFDKIKKIE